MSARERDHCHCCGWAVGTGSRAGRGKVAEARGVSRAPSAQCAFAIGCGASGFSGKYMSGNSSSAACGPDRAAWATTGGSGWMSPVRRATTSNSAVYGSMTREERCVHTCAGAGGKNSNVLLGVPDRPLTLGAPAVAFRDQHDVQLISHRVLSHDIHLRSA